MNNWQLLQGGIGYGLRAYKQWKFLQTFLHPIVNRICQEENYLLTDKERKKITFYYPLFNHIVNCENYLAVKGRALNVDESKRLAIISVMATLFDDLIDEDHAEKDRLDKLLDKKLTIQEHTAKTRLFAKFDEELLLHWQPTDAYQKALKIATDWQVVSAKQLNPHISLDEVLSISKSKCGTSSLLWASCLDENWEEPELEFMYQSGFVGQLVNDLFDAYKDRADGVFTFVHKSASISEAKDIFLGECQRLNTFIHACPVSLTHRTSAVNRFACIHSFGLVALQHLQKTENRYPKPLDWQLPCRQELVTDMALWQNKWALAKNARLLSRL